MRQTSVGSVYDQSWLSNVQGLDNLPRLAGMQDEASESAQKLAEAERLRQAEKFMVVGTGEATCMGCGYEYQPKNGDPEYPITPGTYFSVRPVFIIQLFIQGVVCADVASHTQTTA